LVLASVYHSIVRSHDRKSGKARRRVQPDNSKKRPRAVPLAQPTQSPSPLLLTRLAPVDGTVVIEHRPDHDVTVAVAFRALTTEPDLLTRLLAANTLPEETKELARKSA
jgi:hypothetical protein